MYKALAIAMLGEKFEHSSPTFPPFLSMWIRTVKSESSGIFSNK